MKFLREGPEYDLILINLDNNIRENLIMKFSNINIQFNLDIIIVFIIQWVLASIISSLSCSNLLFRSCLIILFENQAWYFKIFPYVSLDLLLLRLRALTTYGNAPDNCFFYIHSILVLVTQLELFLFSVDFSPSIILHNSF